MPVTRSIKGFNGKYSIDESGTVYSTHSGELTALKPMLSRKGYLNIRLNENGKSFCASVHRLLYEAYIGNITKDMQIDHLDGVKTNNSIDNLEAVSGRENSHRYHKNRNSSSQFIGVDRKKSGKSFRARIMANGRYLHLITDKDEAFCGKVYEQALDAHRSGHMDDFMSDIREYASTKNRKFALARNAQQPGGSVGELGGDCE